MIIICGQSRVLLLAIELVPSLDETPLPWLAGGRYWHAMLLARDHALFAVLLVRYHLLACSCRHNLLPLVQRVLTLQQLEHAVFLRLLLLVHCRLVQLVPFRCLVGEGRVGTSCSPRPCIFSSLIFLTLRPLIFQRNFCGNRQCIE